MIEQDYKTLDITSLVQNLVKYNEQLYKDKNLEIGFEAETSIRKAFRADENGIKLALQNIFDTVVRYMDLGNINVVLSVPSTNI